ncbi:hypothetical protein BDM02DRAFT_3121743 [Thelephora ganbajun]|uniref:Uncharacterized protein n=1 Tax=Thelephora ganbajun TaxID=370292 RepID=A0ACB6Z4U5_THEGA|nr:hypothetical protein BDM02DRAFT_3121743 [Thelephora ganbajun]
MLGGLALNCICHLLSRLPTTSGQHVTLRTDGKDSVPAPLSSIPRTSSPPLSVGRFNSPHLLSTWDSIVISSQLVTVDVYDQVREKLNQQLGVLSH